MIARFLDRSGDFAEAAQMMTIAADSIARRLLELAEEQFGAPPVPYAFVVLGSQGRREMGLSSDQDNAMVLSNDYDPNQHGEYFANLARWVCEGLAEAGQAWCPGDMMATNPLWRQTAREWEDTFHSWITAPDADALLHAQTFSISARFMVIPRLPAKSIAQRCAWEANQTTARAPGKLGGAPGTTVDFLQRFGGGTLRRLCANAEYQNRRHL